jgi:hypothetical protein
VEPGCGKAFRDSGTLDAAKWKAVIPKIKLIPLREPEPEPKYHSPFMKLLTIAIALALTVSALDARAQTPAGTPPPNAPGGGPGRGRAGQHHPQSPERIAEELMKKFDADKDGELSQSELTQALEALREHHFQRPGGAGATPPAQGASDGTQAHPGADKIAAHMIEKFSSDKKGLTVAELAKAIAERRANRGQHGTPQTGAQPSTPTS